MSREPKKQPTWLEIFCMWVLGGLDIVLIGSDFMEAHHLLT